MLSCLTLKPCYLGPWTLEGTWEAPVQWNFETFGLVSVGQIMSLYNWVPNAVRVSTSASPEAIRADWHTGHSINRGPPCRAQYNTNLIPETTKQEAPTLALIWWVLEGYDRLGATDAHELLDTSDCSRTIGLPSRKPRPCNFYLVANRV